MSHNIEGFYDYSLPHKNGCYERLRDYILYLFISKRTTKNLNCFFLNNSYYFRTCQLVLGAGAVSLAGLKTITIRNLAITLRSLEFVTTIVPHIRQNRMH